jgi:O-6-methylguanine DNA methyltransferase
MKKNMRTTETIVATLAIKTPDGVFAAHYSTSGLAELDFPGPGKISETSATSPSVRRWHKLTTRAAVRILEGKDPGQLPPLDLTRATPFRRKVWAALQQIQSNKTQSYGQVATAIGAPKAARAVGSACGANPIPLLIPCHRVLASGGALGGFSGGLPWKRKLLGIENSEFRTVN